MTPRTPQQVHDRHHSIYFWTCFALVMVDVVLFDWAQTSVGLEAARMFLFVALPSAAFAVMHWMASRLPANKCPCTKRIRR